MKVLREAAFFSFFVLLAIVLTWPLARERTTAVSDRGDPMLNAFILDWVCHALIHQPLKLFDAPIFFPFRFPLALSEHMTGLALLVLPFHLAGAGAIELHTMAMLISFALAGYGAFVLARMVSTHTVAALTAGVFFAFVSFKFDHLAHVQVIASGWIPLTLAGLLRFHRTASACDAALFAAAFTMNGLTNIYWLNFTGFAVVATIAFLEATGRPFHRRKLLFALIASAAVLLPFLIPYEIVSKSHRMYRTSFESARGSAIWSDWLAASPASLLYGRFGGGGQERHLFPGVLPIALSLVGITTLAGLEPAEGGRRRHVVWLAAASTASAIAGLALLPLHRSDVPFMIAAVLAVACLPLRRLRDPVPWLAVLWMAIGVIGSFGERAFLHPFLFRIFEPFRATRTPSRWSVIAYCGMAVLAAVGAARLSKVRYLVLLLAMVEVAPRIRWDHVPVTFPPVYHWLAEARPEAAIELPIGRNELEARYTLASSIHRVPIMNGVSGFDTPLHHELATREYDSAMLDRIVRNGVGIVIVHPEAAERAQWWIAGGMLEPIARFPDGDTVYRIATRKGQTP